MRWEAGLIFKIVHHLNFLFQELEMYHYLLKIILFCVNPFDPCACYSKKKLHFGDKPYLSVNDSTDLLLVKYKEKQVAAQSFFLCLTSLNSAEDMAHDSAFPELREMEIKPNFDQNSLYVDSLLSVEGVGMR